MAIKLEFINVIVPIATIREKLGESAFEERFAINTGWAWYDDYLYREGCMNEYNLYDDLEDWKNEGFTLYEIIDGKKYWSDLCVAFSHHGPSYPCPWLEYDKNQNIVWLKGHSPGQVVGPETHLNT